MFARTSLNVGLFALSATMFSQQPAAPSQSASSFRDLASVDSRLKRLLDWDNTYVCFRKDKDIFYVASFESPLADEWKKVAGSDELVQKARAVLSEYRDGIYNETGQQMHPIGAWHKSLSSSLFFEGEDHKGKGRFTVDEDVLSIQDEYLNSDHYPVLFHMTIQRSTERARVELDLSEPGHEVKPFTQLAGCVLYSEGKLNDPPRNK